MRTTILVLCVGVFGLLSGTPFTMATGDITEKKAEPAKLESLEKMQAQALQNNLDIKVAEAKLRLAQAELERVQARVKARVAELHSDLDAALAGEKEAQTRFKRAEQLSKSGDIVREDLDGAFLTYDKLRKDRIAIEHRLNYLVNGTSSEPKLKK